MPPSEPLTNRDFAALVKTWLTETIRTEIDKTFPVAPRPKEELGTMLQKGDAAAKRIRAKRFREALTGLESLLMGADEIDYRAVLDRVLHNIGANLQALDILIPQTGLEEPVEFDYRALASFPAKVSLRRYVKLPRTTEALMGLGVGRYCPPNTSAYLSEYRQWQPRWFRRPAHDDERMGLFLWANLYRDASFLPMGTVPHSRLYGNNEVVLVSQRLTLWTRLMDDAPRREEHLFRLSPRDFTTLLRALLLDYEALHTARQREVGEQDQLGALLWDFLSQDDQDSP